MAGFPTGALKKVFAVLLVVLAVFAAGIGFLPLLAENILLPQVLPAELAEEYEISIYRLGLHGGTFNISDRTGKNPLVTTGTLRIEWTPGGLREGRFDMLTLDGLRLIIPAAASGNDTGASLPAGDQGNNESLQNNGAPSLPPLIIDAVRIVNSTVSIHSQLGDSVFPFSLSGQRLADTSLTEKGILKYLLDVSFASQELTAEVQYLHGKREISAAVEMVSDLNLLAEKGRNFITVPSSLAGQAEVRFSASAKFPPFSVQQLDGEIKLQDLLFADNDVLFRSGKENPSVISFSGTPDELILEAGDFILEKPFASAMNVDATVSSQDKAVNWQANLHAEPVAGLQLGGGYILTSVSPLEFDLTGEYEDRTMHLALRSANKPDNREVLFIVQDDGKRLQIGRMDIDADVQTVLEKGEGTLQGRFFVRGEEVSVAFPGGEFLLPHIQLGGTGILDAMDVQGGSSVIAELQLGNASFTMDSQGLKLQGIELEAPLAWPVNENTQKTGIFQVAEIVLREVNLGKIRAEMIPRPEKMEFKGSMTSGLIPAGEIGLHVSLHIPEPKPVLAELHFSMAETPVEPGNFTGLFPALGELQGSGQLSLQGQGTAYTDSFSGSLSVELDEGNLEVPGIKTRMEGIHLTADFPDLPSLHTSPNQNFSIRSLESKKIELSDVQSFFRLESPQSLFVEKMSANWSGGRVFTSSFRLQTEKPDIEVALICDRLHLSEVLTQLGLARAEGQGAVSGLIPLLYDSGNIYVDHGFLFSTPGEQGILKIIESEQLTEGIPEDVPHFSPLLFAGAALKNFQYDWAKLLISSEEENLLLQLKIDGKPAETLPYRFDPKENVFRKLASGESGGIDQPIKLDVNFNVPLNELMRYNKELQSILKNTR